MPHSHHVVNSQFGPNKSKGMTLLQRIFFAFVGFVVLAYIGMMAQFPSFVEVPLTISTTHAQDITTTCPKSTAYFDCSQIDNLTIVKELGSGNIKTVYEVILPTGEHVAAKRCSARKRCERTNAIMYEEFFYRKLYEAFGEKALAYYGFCSFNSGHISTFDRKNFSMGSTLFIELGTPVLDKWSSLNVSQELKIRPQSKEDLNSLRDIARQYDAFPGGPLRIHGDNIYPHQYMRNKAGKLCHIDFDMVEQMPPPVHSILEENCAVLLWGFAHLKKGDPRLNCSIGYTELNIGRTEIAEPTSKATTTTPTSKATTTTLHSIHQDPFVNQTDPPFIISPLPTNMAFVHIGKTAGSTITGNLRHGCHMFVPHPCRGTENKNFGTKGGPGEESRVSQLTKGYYHFNPVPVDRHDGYIISSRNPIDRVVSAFLYVHPSNVALTTKHRARFRNRNRGKENPAVEEYEKFYKCFPDVPALALNLVGDGECATLGRYVLGGAGTSIIKSEMLNHFGFGYIYYATNLLAAGSRIFAVRQEHLAMDWINFNLRLGGAPHEMSGTAKAFKDQLKVKKPPSGLNKNESHGLCVALADELKVYMSVIDAADNLTEEEKEESRQEIREMCSL